VVDQVFAAFEPFARYGFNKAHATCYGLIAYQTAYLKANYPVEFMTAVLNGFRERAEKVAAVVAECRRPEISIEVHAPDVQRSRAAFTVETDADGAPVAIRFGLAAIKNVGQGMIEAIVAAREGRSETSGVASPFASFDEFCRRVDYQTLNTRAVESLAKARAFDGIESLESLLAIYSDGTTRIERALERGAKYQREVTANQTTLFASADLANIQASITSITADAVIASGADVVSAPIERKERLRWEKELLGLYLSEHPLGDIADQLPEYVTAYTGDLAEESDQAKVTLGGIIQSTRRVITRAGSTMLVATIEDLQGSVEVVVFPKVFAETGPAWADDAVVLITGRVDRRDEAAQLLCETVIAWDDAVRMGALAFSAERDRLARARGRPGSWPSNGNGNGNGHAPSVAPPGPPVAVPRGVSVAEPVTVPVPASMTAIPVGPVEAADEPPAPRDAIPVRAAVSEGEVPPRGAGTISIGFASEVDLERLLPAIESLTAAIRGRPGSLPVVINIPVAGATRQVRLPLHAEWDEQLGDLLTRAAGLPLAVSLLAVAVEP
jgi:DNA polymerase-3 subunit alpha